MLLEFADDIVYGLRAMMKAVAAPEGVILIEDNKPDAVALMEEKVKPYDNIRVVAAKMCIRDRSWADCWAAHR